jgi:hypothetical protein
MRVGRLRWALALAGLATALAATTAAFVRIAINHTLQPLPIPAPSVMAENAHRIVGGMTPIEVAALLGGPPGDYSKPRALTTRSLTPTPPPGGSVAYWLTDDRDIGVAFDTRGLAIQVSSYVAGSEASIHRPYDPAWIRSFSHE